MLAIMRRVLIAAALVCLPGLLPAENSFYLKDGDTVVFYGDSITDSRLYTVYTEAYALTRFPHLKARFVHSGVSGDRVSGGALGSIDVRLQRDAIVYQPTVVTIMLGMNDGRYRAFEESLFREYAAGYESIVKTLQGALPKVRITVMVPSPYDDVTRAPLFEGGYNEVLLRYGQFIRELARKAGLTVADLNTGVVEALRKAKVTDPPLAEEIIPDRVHPAAAGHALMAEGLLKAWNMPAIVTEVEIDAKTMTVKRAVNTDVSSLERAGDSLSWTQADEALPLPIDWTDKTLNLAIQSSDLVTALDEQPLRVSGLKPGQYALKIDGETVDNFSAEQWTKGVNLATRRTPMLKQSLDVLLRSFVHNQIHFARWRIVQLPLEKLAPEHYNPAMADLDALETEAVTAQREAAQPKPHRYEITPLPEVSSGHA
jgi:lysophospholipase L1-like esterase